MSTASSSGGNRASRPSAAPAAPVAKAPVIQVLAEDSPPARPLEHTLEVVEGPGGRPIHLVVMVELPMCESAAGCDLECEPRALRLSVEEPAPGYALELHLPHPVDDAAVKAKFDKKAKRLRVTLPVV